MLVDSLFYLRGFVRHFLFKGDPKKCRARDLSDFNIVITTYGLVRSEYKALAARKKTSKKRKNLFDYTWLRILCDEATAIHNFKTGISK